MARSLKSLLEVTTAVIDSKPWEVDPRCVALPWRDNMYQDMLSRSLTIGVIQDDGVVAVHPPIRRALQNAVSRLQQAGHEIVPWDTSSHGAMIQVQVSPDSLHRGREHATHSNPPGSVLHCGWRRRYSTGCGQIQ